MEKYKRGKKGKVLRTYGRLEERGESENKVTDPTRKSDIKEIFRDQVGTY